MARHGLLTPERGADARQRIARLTARARELLPLIEAEWAATDAALSTPAISAVSGGLGCVALAALIGLLFPAFARYRSIDGRTSYCVTQTS